MDEPDDEGARSSQNRPAPGWMGATVGLALAALVAGPMVGRGQVLLLDWVSGPHALPIDSLLGAGGNTLGGTPFLLLLRAMRAVVGPSVSSWLPLVAWMPLVGWGVGRLTRHAGWPAAAAAAALACFNPFTLDRLAVGQTAVLWAYALLPLAVLTLRADPHRRLVWAARAGLVGAALAAITPHFFAYWVVLLLVSVALLPMVRRRGVAALIALCGALGCSVYLFAVRQPAQTVSQADLSAFRTGSEPPGLAVTILTLRGFWRQSGVAPSRSLAAWALVVLLGACVALGVAAWRRREAAFLCVVGLLGGLLAAGDQGVAGGLYRFAFQHFGPFRILREPQKASALLAVAASVFFGFGVAKLVSLLDWGNARAGKAARAIGAAVLIAAPIGTAPALAGVGKRADVQRPSAAWRQADRLVGSGPAGVLALPWHLYLGYPGMKSTVANLAPTRFRAPVVAGDNVELSGIVTTSTLHRSKYLEERFLRGPELTDFGRQIEPAGLGWVLLVKSVDWEAYRWLDQQHDLVRVLDTSELSLYQSNAPTELSPRSASRHSVGEWHVRSAFARPVPIPELVEARWFAPRGRVAGNEAGAPAIESPGTTVRSRNVQVALRGLAASGTATLLLALVAWGRRPRLARRARRDQEVGQP